MKWYENPADWPDGMHQTMAAQALNISRIRPGLVCGTDVNGQDVVCRGKCPEVIKTYAQPSRLLTAEFKPERVVTIGPIDDSPKGAIVNRDDRQIDYFIACQITLTEEEQAIDKAEDGAAALLTRKAADWNNDLRAVFNENDMLAYDAVAGIREGCSNGVIEFQIYTVQWDHDIQYPSVLVIWNVRGWLY